MKLGLFGGSFDPIHRGHIEPVDTARRELGLDRVIYLPTARPPHKQQQTMAPALQRYAMVELALLEFPHCFVSPVEMGTDQPAYAVDSVRHFRREYSNAELFLIMGGDSFCELDKWREWREIVAMARIAVLVRPGTEAADFEGKPFSPESDALLREQRASLVHNAAVDISSSELRALLSQGSDLAQTWMPESVVHYIQKYSLYR